MLLSIPNSFVATTTILSAAVNANFSTIASWANGNISNDNIGTLDGPLSWTISGNSLALSIGSASTTGIYVASLTGILASTKSAFDLQSSAAQTTGRALAYLSLGNSSSTIPALLINNVGTGLGLEITSTTKGSIPAPKMTTAQRDSIASPTEGEQIYNTTVGYKQVRDASGWRSLTMGQPDGSTLERSGDTLQIKNLGVTTAKLADGALSADASGRAKMGDGFVTRAKLEAVGQQVSSSSGSFNTNSTSLTDVTNLSVTITTTGRPVIIGTFGDSSTGKIYISDLTADESLSGSCVLKRDSTTVGGAGFGAGAGVTTTNVLQGFVGPSLIFIDVPAAGTYTYKLQAKVEDSDHSLHFDSIKLFAFEL